MSRWRPAQSHLQSERSGAGSSLRALLFVEFLNALSRLWRRFGCLLIAGLLLAPVVGFCGRNYFPGCVETSPYPRPGEVILGRPCPLDADMERRLWIETAQKYIPLAERASVLGDDLERFVGAQADPSRPGFLRTLLSEYNEVTDALRSLPMIRTDLGRRMKSEVADMLQALDVLHNLAIAPYLEGGKVVDEEGRKLASTATLALLISQRQANEVLFTALQQHGLELSDVLSSSTPPSTSSATVTPSAGPVNWLLDLVLGYALIIGSLMLVVILGPLWGGFKKILRPSDRQPSRHEGRRDRLTPEQLRTAEAKRQARARLRAETGGPRRRLAGRTGGGDAPPDSPATD